MTLSITLSDKSCVEFKITDGAVTRKISSRIFTPEDVVIFSPKFVVEYGEKRYLQCFIQVQDLVGRSLRNNDAPTAFSTGRDDTIGLHQRVEPARIKFRLTLFSIDDLPNEGTSEINGCHSAIVLPVEIDSHLPVWFDVDDQRLRYQPRTKSEAGRSLLMLKRLPRQCHRVYCDQHSPENRGRTAHGYAQLCPAQPHNSLSGQSHARLSCKVLAHNCLVQISARERCFTRRVALFLYGLSQRALRQFLVQDRLRGRAPPSHAGTDCDHRRNDNRHSSTLVHICPPKARIACSPHNDKAAVHA